MARYLAVGTEDNRRHLVRFLSELMLTSPNHIYQTSTHVT
jgi:hypothetical protein